MAHGLFRIPTPYDVWDNKSIAWYYDTMSSPFILPIITVQPTFRDVISDVKTGQVPFDSFWVSCYKDAAPSVHEKIQVTLDEVDRDLANLEPRNGSVAISLHPENLYSIQCPSLDIAPTNLFCATKEYVALDINPKLPQHIAAFDISPDGAQFAVGFRNGSIQIQPTAISSSQPDPSRMTISKPHASSLTSLRFFPSSRVLLTTGADFTMTILPAEPLQHMTSNTSSAKTVAPVRTLKGHTRSVSSSAIIARGRNVLSSSTDGTVRLWDVSTATQVTVMTTGMDRFTPATCMSLGDQGEWEFAKLALDGQGTAAHAADNREVETSGKTVVCGLYDGSFEVFDLGSKRSAFRSVQTNTSRSPLTAIDYSPKKFLLATGSNIGVVNVYDTRSLSEPLLSFTRNSATIEDLAFMSNDSHPSRIIDGSDISDGLAVATADGLPYIASTKARQPAVLGELVGSDCDGVRVARVGADGSLWTAGDDGVVRKY